MKVKLFSSLFSVRSRITNNRNWESETRQNVERAVVSENADGFHGSADTMAEETWKNGKYSRMITKSLAILDTIIQRKGNTRRHTGRN